MDRTDLGQRWSILTLGVAYRKRLLPMTWRILPFGGTGEAVQKRLLSQVAPLLPTIRIHFYGDCEFRAVGLQRYCRDQGWHWHLGIKSDTYVKLASGTWHQLRTLPLVKGERQYWQALYLTQQQRFGPVNLVGDWSANQAYPRFWATDLPADPNAWRRGRKRFWIEVDNFYVKQHLGLADFRVQSFEATEKWFATVFLAYIFLQWRLNHATPDEQFRSIADVIRHHRQEHARTLLEVACQEAVRLADYVPLLQRFICSYA